MGIFKFVSIVLSNKLSLKKDSSDVLWYPLKINTDWKFIDFNFLKAEFNLFSE